MATAVSAPSIDPLVAEFIARTHRLLINGKWVPAASGRTFASFNPANGEILSQIAEGDREDIDRAVKAARAAFETGPWSRMTASERGRAIWRLGDLIDKHDEELAQLESLDNGKPLAVARAADVRLAADLFHYMAGWATKLEDNTIPLSTVPYTPGAQYLRLHRLARARWSRGPDHPMEFPAPDGRLEARPGARRRLHHRPEARGTDSALGASPRRNHPRSWHSRRRREHRHWLYGETAGAALAAHPDVDKVAFTGSTEVGKLIVHASTGNLKKVSLELGGKSPNLVLDDADLDSAIPGAANAIFFNHGQCCCAGSRLYVESKSFDPRRRRHRAVRRQHQSRPRGFDPDTQMGFPLVSEEQLNRVTAYLESLASPEGAKARRRRSKRVGDKSSLREAHRPGRHQPEDESRAGRNLWPGGHRDSIQERRRSCRNRQRFHVRPRRWRMDARHQARPFHRREAEGGDRLDQLLQHLRRGAPVRWLQAVRLGPRHGPRSPRKLHRSQSRLRRFVLTWEGRSEVF